MRKLKATRSCILVHEGAQTSDATHELDGGTLLQ